MQPARYALTPVNFMPKILIAFILLVSLTACGAEKHKAESQPPKVTVVQPIQKSVTNYLEMPGNLQAIEKVDLVARVEGFLQSIHFEDGAFVEKGQLLFVIEPQPFEAQLQMAEATVEQQEATLIRAKEEYARQLRMIKHRATSESAVQQWRAEYDSAKALLKENKAKAELAQINLGYTRITAPFDGRMERHLVDPGNLVGASGPTKLVTIYRLNPIFAYFNVNEYDLTRLIRKVREEKASTYQPGKIPVFLGTEGEADYPHKGTLDYASAALDQTTGSLQLRGTFPNPMINHVPALLPGMYARVRIPIEVRKNALLIPEDALGITQGQRFLLTVNDQNVVEQHSVTVGKKIKDLRVVEEGLKSTDWVIVTGVQFAHPGSKVTPVRNKVPDDATN